MKHPRVTWRARYLRREQAERPPAAPSARDVAIGARPASTVTRSGVTRWRPATWWLAAAWAWALAILPTQGLAQTAAPAASVTQEPAFKISAGYEAQRDRVRYDFANPSSFDTPFLVPHRYAQTYVADNQWLVVNARYRLSGSVLETEVGLTPHKTAFASDLDTFFNPNGDVIVSGTASEAAMHALRVAQWLQAGVWAIPVRVGFAYRRDEAEFQSPDERLVAHSNPPSQSRTPISTHETTISGVREMSIGSWRQVAIGPRWRITAGADVAPLILANLTTILPEKYPGEEIVSQALAAGLTTRLELAWQQERWLVAIALSYGRMWSYASDSQFSRDALQFSIRLGM